MQALTTSAAAICLCLVLAGCETQPVRVETRTEYRYPPDTLIQDCPVPAFEGHTIGDAVDYIPRLLGALRACNEDKRAIRELKASHD